MKRLQVFRSALVGGASVLALVHPAAAKVFDIPEGDLVAALGSYMQQAGVEIIYSEDILRGHKSRGAKGDYTETAALTQLLRGTGFTTQSMSASAIAIVPQPKAPAPVKLAQAARRAPAAAAPMAPTVETVVVTAQKKQENIQSVPIAITALSQQQLTERQIAAGPDLIKEVPNLTFSKTNFTGYNLEIRGVGTQAISVTTDPAVAVAFNGIPFIRNHFFEQEFYDLDNLEVLRGPQGTLYGRNATGGVVNILSAKPTDTYEAMLSADIGNYSNRRLEGMINLPIVGDTLDLRIAGEWTKRDGYDNDALLDTSIDGRDLWSGRMTLGWKPASNIQTYLVWEHFSENDDRLRSGKQLCKTAPIPAEVGGQAVPSATGDLGDVADIGDYLSQGCENVSLYSPQAFEVPNGYTLTYYAPLADANVGTKENFDVYGETTQSTNLRDVESAVLPQYRAKNDTLEFNADWRVTPVLTFTSQTGYNNDSLWSTEDYNRFDSTPDAFAGNATFCDPQLGCSNRLVLQDLSTEHAWQLSQEFRLASDFKGPFNFSVGGNYLHYETFEDYYVFINSLSLFAETLVPAVLPDQTCLLGSYKYTIYTNPRLEQPTVREADSGCDYVDPNPLASVNGLGHNYFLSENPYVLNSYAGFGEAYYNLTDDIKLTAGARWTDDQKHFDIIPSELLIPGYGYPQTGQTNQGWDRWTGRFVADWTPQLDFTDQTLIYGSYSHGYKAGGANPPGAFYPGIAAGSAINALIMPAHPLTFGPEYIESFELGTKNTLLDGSLTANGDVFYYNYTGYQISSIVDRTAITQNFNAHMEGAELETTWEPLPGLKFSLAQGFENTGLAGGDRAIDLMDRTAGNPNWIVVKPYVTESSNCILPTYVVAAAIEIGATNDIGQYLCGKAYGVPQLDPITGVPYAANPTICAPSGCTIPPGYIGFNPAMAPNNGEGFYKNLAGNQVPNAPHFTSSLTAEYTMPVSEDWAATLHGDFYWQSQQWARVFEDPIDKIHGYGTTNVSLILTSDNGWQVMGYVKNVFDVTAITGTFLNSDDSGLTTNVFLTDPRLYGIRVTKHLDENDGFWGADYSGYDFFTGLFSDTDKGTPSLWIELGGQLSALEDAQQQFALPFVPDYGGGKSPLEAEEPPRFGFDRDAKISFQPDGSDWVFSGAIRFGRASANRHQHLQTANKNIPISTSYFHRNYSLYPTEHLKFADTITSQSESHAIVDFLVGKDVGLGMFGPQGSSIVSGGVRVAQFISKSTIDLHAEPDVQYYPKTLPKTFPAFYQFIRRADIHFHDYAQTAARKESFHGIGPKLDWSASTPISGNDTDNGEIALDWGANMAVLFGRQKASGHRQTAVNSYYLKSGDFFPGPGYVFGKPHNLKDGRFYNRPWCRSNDAGGGGLYTDCRTHAPPTAHHTNGASHNRSRMVAVPNVGALFGVSYRYRNAKISFGYNADEFFGAMDGGIDKHKSENRGFFGPYANITIGLGG